MDFLRSTWHSFQTSLSLHWNMFRTAISYYASMRVIFYTEISLIMFCFIDLTLNMTLLILLILRKRNYAYMYSAWAIGDSSDNSFPVNDNIFTLVLTFYLTESLIRIYHCLKLAYHHNLKVTEGDLCCMKCHEPLISAAMPGICIVPHFISALAAIVYFIYTFIWTAWETVDYHKRYFANSPFVGYGESNAMTTSRYFEMANHVLTDLQGCRFNKSVPVRTGAVRLLETGSLLTLVEYQCALNRMHCEYDSHYLQLSVESVLALVNYTVIRSLFGHVINMHEFEVYNLQTRLQTRGSCRLIRVYKVRHTKPRRPSQVSAMIQLPRQAIMSLVHMATRIRASTTRRGEDCTLPLAEQVPPTRQPEPDQAEEQALTTQETDSEEASWSDGSMVAKGAGPEKDAKDDWEMHPWEPACKDDEELPKEQQQQDNRIYNRKDAAGDKREDVQHLRIDNLFTTNETKRRQQEQQQQQVDPPQQLPPTQPAAAQETEAASQLLLPGDLDVATAPSAGLDKAKRAARGKQKVNQRVNDSIFTDETFYSLES